MRAAVEKIWPDVRFEGSRGLVLFDHASEHWLFNPTLQTMLQRYLKHPESRAGVREWISERTPNSPYGFIALCDYIDLDADYVRRGLIRWMITVDNGLLGTAVERPTCYEPVLEPHLAKAVKSEQLPEC
jgi:hypothetical protein